MSQKDTILRLPYTSPKYDQFAKLFYHQTVVDSSRALGFHSFHGPPTPSLHLWTSGNTRHSQAKSLLCIQGM